MATNLSELPTPTEQRVEDEQPPELFKKSKATDITLVIDGKELHFGKFPLTQASSVFSQMIESSIDQTRLQLDDVAYKDMLMFLECLHPLKLQEITDTNLEGVVTIAHRYQHDGILAKCEEYITKQFKEQRDTDDGMYDHFFFHLKLAEQFGLKKAFEVGLSSNQLKNAFFFSQNKGDGVTGWAKKGYEDNAYFCELSSQTKLQILLNRLKIAERRISRSNAYGSTV